MEHLTGYNRPKLIRDHLWEHKCSNTKYVLYNKISEQKSPLSGTSISLGCHSKYMLHFLASDSPTHSTLGVIFPFPVIVKKAMMGRMTAVREMTFNNYTVLRTKLNAR